MIAVAIQNYIKESLAQATGDPIATMQLVPVSGGSINLAYELVVNGKESFFCKINSVSKYPALFEKERNGLQLLAAANALRVPEVVLCTVRGDYQVLVMEWVKEGKRTGSFWTDFGKQLATLHQITAPTFGLSEDNYIGALPQANQRSADWVEFFIVHRLMPQVRLSREKELLQSAHVRLFDSLYKKLPGIFPPEPPALLHGDLWHGNFLCTTENEPVVIDPAIYFGHRSMDLAMSYLFAGFDDSFYDSYGDHYPLPENYTTQRDICSLYPLLTHLNLFGGVYGSAIIDVLRAY